MAAPPLASQATLEQKIGAVHLGLPKVLAEALSVVAVEQFLSGHQWSLLGFSRTPASGAIKLWLCNSLLQHTVLPLVQIHDGDDQSNAGVDQVMWVGNRTPLHSFLQRL